ncbi:hypothetical protein [Klebsiella oxytoca]|uniref:hypothetical protein n=1 Tax=Klebsiella oxytoca TaxID=571 RepID=UPI0015E87B4C|nr:hypothetical protein [Klebsiella oxytoca]HCB1502538.1 hypothetical protein [Klebsiella michiganensis]HCB1844000.1 hypothetical protein [Klebsiella oxytoca]
MKAVLSGQFSLTQAATKFNVAGALSVAKWAKVFNEHGEEGLRSLKVGTKKYLTWLNTLNLLKPQRNAQYPLE